MKKIILTVLVVLIFFTDSPYLPAQQPGGGPGYEWGEPVPAPDLGPAPFAPPLPPPTQRGEPSETSGPALDPPPGLVDALSVFPSASQAPLPKALVDTEGSGPVFETNDVEALKRFRLKADQADKLGWSVGEEVTGRGVEADNGGRLLRLILENVGLAGSLELSEAKSLTEVKSVANHFVALRLSSLPSLRILTVTGADFELLPKDSLTGLPSLAVLNLNANHIEEIEAGAFQNLSRLDILNLSDNSLSQFGRGVWAGLESLVDLNLAGNRIPELTRSSLASLRRLINLNLSGNRLREIGEGAFQALGSLESLRLDNNQLTRLNRGTFSGLGSLKNLNLSGNRLSALDASIFTGLGGLSDVDLSTNCLPLGNMKKLQDGVSGHTYLRLRNQRQVYFSLRVQVLSKIDGFTVPAVDASINGLPSRVEVLGEDPAGAVYSPPEKTGHAGRITFDRTGAYRLKISNRELSEDHEVAATTGYILVVDSYPTLEEATDLLGSKDLARALVDGFARRGFIEVPATNPKRVSAIKALLDADLFN